MTSSASRTSSTPANLETAFLGEERRYAREEVAGWRVSSWSEARRLWRAMGFADVGDDVPVFTDADVTALRLVSSLRRRGLLDLETTVHLTRALGRMTGRLVEWQLQTLVERVAADGVTPELAFRAGVEQAAT